MANTVRILITAKDEISGPLDKIRDKLDVLGKNKGAQSILQGVGISVGITAFGMLKNAIGGVTDFVGDLARAGIEEEASIRKLTTSLKANVDGWNGSTAAIEKTIKARIDLGFSDEEQRDSMSRLVAVTKDVNEALRVQRIAMDLARFKGISLAEASDALIKVEAGQYRMLKSLGIVLKEGATQQDALNAVQAVAEGQASDYADTVGGKLLVAQTKWGDKMDELGTQILPTLGNALESVISLLDDMPDPGKGWDDATAGIQDFIDTLPSNKDKEKVDAFSGGIRAGLHDAETSVKDLASSFRDVGKEGRDASKGIDDARDAARDATKKFDDLTESVNDAVDAFISAAFDGEQLGLELKITTQETKDLEKELRGITDGKGRPLKGHTWKEVNALKLEISESKEEGRKLEYRLDTLDGTKLTDVTKATRGLKGQLDLAGDEAAFLHGQLDQISRITFGRYRGKPLPTNADGGDIPPYGTSLVGERGPEIIRMGAVGATISPSAWGPPGPSSTSSVVNVGPLYISGVGSDVSASAARRFGQATLDVIASGLREQRARLGAV